MRVPTGQPRPLVNGEQLGDGEATFLGSKNASLRAEGIYCSKVY